MASFVPTRRFSSVDFPAFGRPISDTRPHFTSSNPQNTILTVRGESPASHRGRRCARLARRDEREYREYLNEEQRSQTGCSAGRMQLDFHHGLLVSAAIGIFGDMRTRLA